MNKYLLQKLRLNNKCFNKINNNSDVIFNVENSTDLKIENSTDLNIEDITDLNIENSTDLNIEDITDLNIENSTDLNIEENHDVIIDDTYLNIENNININNLKYNKPTKYDLIVGFVYFNYTKSKRLLMNYLYTVNKLKLSNIPYYTLELVDSIPEIPEAIHIQSKSIMFQKERLCYLLEKHIPEKYSKILFLDCDIIFDNQNWYNDISNLLETNNIVHPFTFAILLNISYNKIILKKQSILINKKQFASHEEYGWAFQRKWFNKIGFYQYAIIGGGDTFSVYGWLKLGKRLKYAEYNKFYNLEKPKASYISGTIYHLYHGSRNNRQHITRQNILKNINNLYSIRDILIIKENQPFEFKSQFTYLNNQIKKYLINRFDDSI